MKDLPHHQKKLNRQVVRSMHKNELEEEAYEMTTPGIPEWERTEKQKKKQAKARKRVDKKNGAKHVKDGDEKNREMKHRDPVLEKSSHPPMKNASSKKTPPV